MRPRSLLAAVCSVGLSVVLTASAPAATSQSAQAYQAGLEAYVHAYPPLLNRLSQVSFPVNALVGIDATTTPDQRLIVLPNVDTAYTVGRLDLRAGPQVVHVPAIAGRYYSLQLMDAYTNVFGYVGTRTTGTAAGDYAIVGPGFHDALPAGMPALRSPTPDALLLGRTLVDGPADLPAVGTILGQYTLRPLASATATASIVLPQTPRRVPPVLPTGLAFFDAFGQLLGADPPTAAELRSLVALRRWGIGPGVQTSAAMLAPSVRAALVRAVHDGPAQVAKLVAAAQARLATGHQGWSVLDPKTGNTGSDYDLRAVIARIGLWANTPAEATYFNASQDSAGRALSGAHRYALRFTSAPPAKAFWSLTMYDRGLHLYANPLSRYALGDRSRGLRRGAHGAVSIALQHAAPKTGAANWLPAPSGRFTVTLRLYVPTTAALNGGFAPPGIVCLDCPSAVYR